MLLFAVLSRVELAGVGLEGVWAGYLLGNGSGGGFQGRNPWPARTAAAAALRLADKWGQADALNTQQRSGGGQRPPRGRGQ